jgi:hypothetical protein
MFKKECCNVNSLLYPSIAINATGLKTAVIKPLTVVCTAEEVWWHQNGLFILVLGLNYKVRKLSRKRNVSRKHDADAI